MILAGDVGGTKTRLGLFGRAGRKLRIVREGEFQRAFRDKGRLSPLMEKIPVRVILEPRTALIGAASCAAARQKRSS